jgi:cystathionine beta-synthase
MKLDNILGAVGNTPLVKLNRIGKDLKCNLYAKCEFLNPAGSVKDRIALRMIDEAEKSGRIRPGDTLIEPTSGNTGLGMALAGAVKGYNVIITMPEKMSREKQVVLEALGAKIIRTPTEAAWDAPESHIGVARKLQKELPRAHILDQYANPANPDAHFFGTGEEILKDLEGKVDMVVMGAGTGGTITGVAKRIKQDYPKCVVVGADPVGSILAGGDYIASYKVEGIGYDFIPDVLDRKLIDRWVKTNDRQSFLLALRLIKEEGLLCGGSSGSALFAALQEAKYLEKGQNCVVLLPDGVRNYMTKFIEPKWMRENRFNVIQEIDGTVEDLQKQREKLVCVDVDASCSEAIEKMREHGFSQLPVLSKGTLVGMLHEQDLLEFQLTGQNVRATRVESVMDRHVPSVGPKTPLTSVQELLLEYGCVVVTTGSFEPLFIVTNIDLIDRMAH